MSQIDNGGPAFPANAPDLQPDPAKTALFPGMSLRDWFAGQAIAGLAGIEASISAVHSEAETKALLDQVLRVRAEFAYRYADAMIKARSA